MFIYKLINTVWAGLRGALGIVLALIIEINQDKLGISKEDADRQFFYIGGIATLTLIINATLAEKILLALGLVGRENAVLFFIQKHPNNYAFLSYFVFFKKQLLKYKFNRIKLLSFVKYAND